MMTARLTDDAGGGLESSVFSIDRRSIFESLERCGGQGIRGQKIMSVVGETR